MSDDMLAKKIIKLRNSVKIKQIEKLVEEANKLLEKNRDDYTECIQMFPKIFKRLAPRRKVLDIPLANNHNRRIVLHQFGLFYVYGSHIGGRARKVDAQDLFEFLRENDLEVFDRVAEEIKYKNTRIAFRDYCRIVSLFLKDNGIEDMVNKRQFNFEKKCKKEFINISKGKSEKISSIRIKASYENVKFMINGDEFNLSRSSNIENLIVIEQFQIQIIKGLKKIINMIRESNNSVGSQELYRRLNDRFSAYLVANQI
jgi:hypothetical protein